jgi:hypothetical protein
LELGGKYIAADLRDSNDLLGDPAALRRRIDEDGYLLIRAFHDPKQVLEARRALLQMAADNGEVDLNYPLMDGVIAKTRRPGPMRINYTANPTFRGLVESPRVMGFFDRFLGGKAMTYDYKWLRFMPSGGTSGAHYDVVYMGRGTLNLFTVWTPLGDVDMSMGPLCLLLGSHNLPSYAKVRDTYGKSDVDRDLLDGWFSTDPTELVDRYGGRWGTTEFKAGDALIFGMFTMHASVKNTTNRFRISCDTRYQLAGEPVDDRWIGKEPKLHYALSDPANASKLTTMDKAREKWGI